MTIVDPTARRILAYVPENLRDRLAAASAVQVQRPRRPGTRRATRVQSVSAAVVLVPQRLWRDPRQEEWAWEIVLATEGDEAPGERVDLVFGS